MESDEETAAAVVALLPVQKNKKKTKRSVWIKPWLRRRINLGLYEKQVQELRFEDESEYKKLLRMTPQDFDEILKLVKGATKFYFMRYPRVVIILFKPVYVSQYFISVLLENYCFVFL